MSIEFCKFGDIFKYEEEEYVFLFPAEGGVYAVKVLNKQETRECELLCEKLSLQQIGEQGRIIFCFVKLKSHNFKDRIAHFSRDAKNSKNYYPFISTGLKLEKIDRTKILEEIRRDGSTASEELIELTKDIKIED